MCRSKSNILVSDERYEFIYLEDIGMTENELFDIISPIMDKKIVKIFNKVLGEDIHPASIKKRLFSEYSRLNEKIIVTKDKKYIII